jgi:hypothetical protein
MKTAPRARRPRRHSRRPTDDGSLQPSGAAGADVPRWDDAFGWLHAATEAIDVPIKAFLESLGDRAAVQAGIIDLVDQLYASGTTKTGAMALAWSMLTADPRKPHSFSFLPQLQCAIDNADLQAEDDADVRARIRIWWRAAEAEWTDSEVSTFRIAEVETAPDDDLPDDREPELHPQEMTASTSATLFADLGLPTLVVMPESKASKLNNFHAQYKDLVDAPLPLVVAHDVARVRSALHGEFPHATMAVDLLLRDLREGQPFWLKPVLLVGGPGAGKSRLVRRVANLVRNLYVYRFDAASSSDSHFGGTSKAWSKYRAIRAISRRRAGEDRQSGGADRRDRQGQQVDLPRPARR